MKIMVIGANGSLGSEICKQLIKEEINFIPVTRKELDVTIKIDLLESFIVNTLPDVIINCAAHLVIESCKLNLIKKLPKTLTSQKKKIYKKLTCNGFSPFATIIFFLFP